MSPAANFTGDCPRVLFPFAATCSGSGTCVDAQTCLCPAGFTGLGDFAIGAPTCAISIVAVQVLYSVLAVSHCLVLGFVVVAVHRHLSTHTRATAYVMRRRMLSAALLFISSVLLMALGIVRASNPTALTIGTSPVITVLFCFGAAFFWAHLCVFATAVLDMTLRHMRTRSERVDESAQRVAMLVSKGTPLIVIISVGLCLVPLLLLATKNPDAWYAIILLHIVGIGLLCLFLAVAVLHRVTGPLIREVSAAIVSAEARGADTVTLRQGRDKLRRTTNDIVQQGLFNVFIASPFGLLPGLQQVASYWEPVAFTAAAFVAISSLYLDLPTQTKSPVPVEPMASSMVQMRLLKSINEGTELKVGIMRGGVQSYIDPREAERVIDAANVVTDSGDGIVNVSTNHVRTYSIANTLLGRCAPHLNATLFAILRRWVSAGPYAVGLPLGVMTVMGIAVAALTLLEIISAWIAVAVFMPVIAAYVMAAASFLNLTILAGVVRTTFFQVRFTSAVVSCMCMCVTLADARMATVIGLCVLQVFVAAGDCVAGELTVFRVVFLVQLGLNLLMLEIGLFFDLVSYVPMSVPVTASFDWGLVQLARDLYLGTLLVTIFDLVFVLRGSHRTRFATIHDSLKFILRTFEDFDSIGNFEPALQAPAAALAIKSGFLAVPAAALLANNDTAEPAPQVFVYVDMVALSQRDAWACHLFGPKVGERVFRALDSRAGSFVNFFLFALGIIPFILSPWFVSMSYFAIPFIIFYPVRALLMNSRAIMKLLAQRRQVQVESFFLLIWGALWVSVFFTNELPIVSIVLVITSLVDLYKDATVRKRSRVRIVTVRFALGVTYTIFSAFLVAGVFGKRANFHYIDFRPDTAAARMNSTAVHGAYSDQPSVVDLYQQTADLGLAIGVEYIITSLQVIWHEHDALVSMHVPVSPVFT